MADLGLEDLYHDPRHPGAFSGVDKFYKGQTQATRGEVKDFLKQQNEYTLHFPARKRIKRNRVVVAGVNYLIDCDLLSMQNLAEDNDNYQYIISCIDVLSKYAYSQKLKTKSARACRG